MPTEPVLPPAGTVAPYGLSAAVHSMPDWNTWKTWPAIVAVSTRPMPGFGGTVTLRPTLPIGGAVNVRSVLVASHVQLAGV
jgi:hypothetical protein